MCCAGWALLHLTGRDSGENVSGVSWVEALRSEVASRVYQL